MTEASPFSDRACRRRCDWVALAIAAMAASLVVVKTGRDVLYVQEDGILSLPFGYLGMALGAMPVGFAMLGLMRALGVRAARIAAILGVAGVLLVYQGVAEPGGGVLMTSFFVAVPLLYGPLFSVGWLLAAELLEGADPALMSRAYTRIGAGAILGGLAGGLAARGLAGRIDPPTFIGLGAGVLVVAAGVLWLTQRASVRRASTRAPSPRPRLADLRPVLARRYSVLLLAVAVLLASAGLLVEFQFYWVASQIPPETGRTAQIFANVYLALNLCALAAQLLLIPTLHRIFGVHGSLLVMPVALLGGAALVAATAAAGMRAALRVTEGALKASVHRSSWELSFAAYQGTYRPLAKLATGTVTHIGEGVGAVAIYVWLHVVALRSVAGPADPMALNWLLVGIAVALVGITVALRRSIQDPCAYEECRDDVLLPDCCVITAQGGRELIEEEAERAAA